MRFRLATAQRRPLGRGSYRAAVLVAVVQPQRCSGLRARVVTPGKSSRTQEQQTLSFMDAASAQDLNDCNNKITICVTFAGYRSVSL
jgi:hypothetical protein